MPSATFTTTGTWNAPADMQPGSLQIYAWGESGTGGTSAHSSHAGGGSGAGALAGEPNYGGVTAGTGVVSFTIGTGGTATDTVVTGGTGTITAAHGTSAAGQTQGTGGAAGGNTVAKAGGDGAPGQAGATQNGSGGGGSAGSTGAGGSATTSTGGSAGTGAAGPPSLAGAAGRNGAGNSSAGAAGTGPGGGASGGGAAGVGNNAGGAGAPGQVIIIWATITQTPVAYGALTASVATSKAVSGAVKGYLSFTGAPLPVGVVNQWTGTFAQPAAFGPMPPALQSTVIELNPGTSAGIGSGVPTAGNWLFCVTGMTQQSAVSGFTVGDSDDIHSFWRPGDVTTSTWAVSPKTGKTRTSIWYTANLARQPGDVYVAPNGCMAGQAVTVLEVAGLSPWDVVTGIFTGYAAAATLLNLALSAPPGPAFILAAACGDSTAATQALTPGSPWHTLTTVSASNGTDHTCDAVLTTAYLSTTSGSVSVNATAGSATDLSGVIIGVQCTAPSPVPAGANKAWPGRFIVEAALGSGFETPADEMTWTTLNDNGVPATQATKRLWSWHDSGGVPYALGQLQSGEGAVQLDNADGALTPSNSTTSPYYPNVVTGTPIRLRCAIGTLADRQTGNVTADRWYVIQRNILDIPEKRNDAWRNFVEMSLTDIWSVVAGACPTPYRGEVEQDNPGWWYPCDDQALSGGVLPTSLRNAAKGSATALQIIASPGGVGAQDAYAPDGTDLTAFAGTFASPPPPGVAVYAVAQDQGWLYGDPQSGPQSAQSGNPVTAQPGSAGWQQTGLLGNTGSAGWFLAANDTFPSLTTGITVEGWWNYAYYAGAAAFQGSQPYNVLQQPYAPQTLFALHTSSAPIAILQLDRDTGHLNLITYNGGTPTSHSVYTGSDLRCDAWIKVTVSLTASTWAVKVNAGLTASASGSATISPTSPTWLIANGDLGTSGGSSLSAIQHGGNVKISHLAVYPGIVPAWREDARYCAGITGFGLLPAPQGTAATAVQNAHPTGFTPDGSEFGGNYGISGASVVSYSLSALAVAVAGTLKSGPSQRAVIAGSGTVASPVFGAAAWTSWTAVAPLVQVFTSAAAVTETEAAACLSSGDSFVSGFGSGASGGGVGQVSGGTGASPPSAPTATGDTVAQRLERIAGYGGITSPNRSIDSTASALVQAALDIGGHAAGSSAQNIQQSDNGMLFIDNGGAQSYRSRAHLASDAVVWNLSSAGPQYGYPYQPSQSFGNDPQKLFNAIDISPYSPDGSSPAALTPSNATAVAASQLQYGPKPLAITSYLQSGQQAQADWIFDQYGTLRRRVAALTVDAAGYPPAWIFVLGANVSDLVQVTDQPMLGGPLSVGTYRISSISGRTIAFGANQSKPQAAISIIADFEPGSYWS